MKLNREYEICLDIYQYLNDKPTKCQELADKLRTSGNHLHGLTRLLRLKGLVRILKGPKGGIMKPDHKVSALDVYLAINNNLPQNKMSEAPSSKVSNSILTLLDATILVE